MDHAAAMPAFARTPGSAAGPEDDPVYRDLCLYRQPEILTAALRQAWPQGSVCDARLLQCFYNPYSRARAVAEVRMDNSAPVHWLSLKFFATRERAEQAYAAALLKPLLPASGPPLLFLGDRIVAWWLPNGQNLRRIRMCYDRERYTRYMAKLGLCAPDDAIEMPELIRYIPRRRALFRWTTPEGRRLYLKFYAATESKIPARNLSLLNTAEVVCDLRLPKLLRHNRRRAFIVMEEVPGLPLTDLVAEAELSIFEQIARALVELHESRIEPRTHWSGKRALRALIAATAELKAALPRQSAVLDALVERLVRERPASIERKPIHANLFGDQILVSGQRIGMVDWDDLARGDPLHDLGRLAAHLIYLSVCGRVTPKRVAACISALLSAYESALGTAIHRGRLRWHVAMELIMRAKISALRPLSPEWAMHIDEALLAAQDVLDGGCFE